MLPQSEVIRAILLEGSPCCWESRTCEAWHTDRVSPCASGGDAKHVVARRWACGAVSSDL